MEFLCSWPSRKLLLPPRRSGSQMETTPWQQVHRQRRPSGQSEGGEADGKDRDDCQGDDPGRGEPARARGS